MYLSNYADAKTLDAQVYIGKYSEQKKDNQRHFKKAQSSPIVLSTSFFKVIQNRQFSARVTL